ncbi:MAG: ribonuclease PH [Myxococcales bacterium]|nr:ribonuclease PH [Polyangiaceae bacterium]MDW8248507.1 ribonuclease PH [Myxococcales bacterium]
MFLRRDGRALDAPRSVEILPGFHRLAEGSCLYRAGGTVVLCTASVADEVPAFLRDTGKGWVTAEYQMHPRISAERREPRDGRGKALSGRTQEIQRLVGRALRAAVDMSLLGPRTITIDCDVLEADGGTRTASITGGFIALALALHKLHTQGVFGEGPGPLRDQVASISAGLIENVALLDLDYSEDSRARVDLNLVATAGGAIVEVQGTAEGAPIPRETLDRLVDLSLAGVQALCKVQRTVLISAGVDLVLLGSGGVV